MNSYTTLKLSENKEGLFYKNDLGITQIGDPFILKASDGFYYLYCTSAANGYYCWKSSDLVNWTDKKMCFVRKTDSWCIDSFWAPEVVQYSKQYYMYYTAKNADGSLRIGVALSETPDGPYTDVKNEPLFDFGYATIDPNVLVDQDGSKYLYFSKDCSENVLAGLRRSEIYGIRLSDDMLSVIGEPVMLVTPTQKWEKASTNPVWNEGPEILIHNNTYYLSYSANCYADHSYSVGYATSSSPLGPFTKAEENPILTSGTSKTISGPGHHSFTLSPDGAEIWMAYHTHTDPVTGGGNRKLNIDRVLFTDDGKMYVNGPTLCSLPIPSNGSYTNFAPEAKIDLPGIDTALLQDGIFTLHKKDSKYDCTIPVNKDTVHEEQVKSKTLKASPNTANTDSENANAINAASGNFVNVKTISIPLSFDKPVKISSILVFRGTSDSRDFSSVKAILDNKWITEEYPISENTDERAAILNFEEKTVSKIELILTPKNPDNDVSLSEIMIIGCK